MKALSAQLHKFNNFKIIVLIFIVIIFFALIFYNVFANSKNTKILIDNKKLLMQDLMVMQQVSTSLDSLLRMNANSENFSSEKTEALQNLESVLQQSSTVLGEDLEIRNFLLIKEPEIINQLYQEKAKLYLQRRKYLTLFQDFVEQLKMYDSQTSVLYQYDVGDDFAEGITEENIEISLERASLAQQNIEAIANEISQTSISTERIRTTINELNSLQDRFSEVIQLLEEREIEEASALIAQMDQDYPRIERIVFAGLLSIFTTEQNLEFFTLQNNLIEKYEYYIDSITIEQNRMNK